MATMIEFRVTLIGTSPLLMHNSRLANPLDPAAKAVKRLTSKRNKTDDDYLELAHVEWLGGLYHEVEVGPYIPADNIFRCMWDAAKKHKLGVKVKEGIFFNQDINPLIYKGPRDTDGLWADENYRFTKSVKVGQQRVMRTRPQFREWAVETVGLLDPGILDLVEMEQIVDTAGLVIGLADWRPRYGRFTGTLERI